MSARRVERGDVTQTVRKIAFFAAFALFQLLPLFHLFLSPVVSVVGAFRGILVASLLTYGFLALASLLLGRAFCGWFCPGAAVQECCTALGAKRLEGRRKYWSKYVVFGLWAAVILIGVVHARGFHQVDLMFGTAGAGATRSFLFRYGAFLIVVPPALLVGRWATCHYLCWIAPLMIFGSRLGQRTGLPSLRVAADPGKCRRCTLCSRTCPMSLDVQEMVLAGAMRSDECILCGHCISVCPSRAVRFSFGRRLRTAGPVSQPSA